MKEGIELDALIAEKVMRIKTTKGYQSFHYMRGCIGSYVRNEFRDVPFPDLQILKDPLPDHFKIGGPFQMERYDPCPESYSTDIKAAWQVVEKFHKDKWRVDVYCPEEHESGIEWRCELAEPYRSPLKDICVNVAAPTAPLAICLAALKALDVKI